MIKTQFYTSREELECALQNNLPLFNRYASLHGEWKTRFIDFMTGKKTLPLTYDPFFKCIFNPDIHPERLEKLLGSILGEPIRIQSILPSENVVLSADSLLIMDILVRLSDGSLANVEIQKIPYQFPAERMSCYSADLLLRQYTRLKPNDDFKYSDMKKVYTIILFEKSTGIFHDNALHGAYFHHGKTAFNTGLPLELLQEYFLISLDVFRENGYAKNEDDLSIWLSLLATETIADAEALIMQYPWLEEIYAEMANYMQKPEEVLTMFSEALKIMDQNTVRFMMDEMQQELSDAKSELSDTKQQFINYIITTSKEQSASKEETVSKLMSNFHITHSEAQTFIEKYW
ncbi:MAG: PD-(D/E)XK nuclease family transposase [Wujia sp.]